MLNPATVFCVDGYQAHAASSFFFDLRDPILDLLFSGFGRNDERGQHQQSKPAHVETPLPAMKRRMPFLDRDENSAARRANFSATTQRPFNCRHVPA
jgi:hypothetical protein